MTKCACLCPECGKEYTVEFMDSACPHCGYLPNHEDALNLKDDLIGMKEGRKEI